MNPPSVRADAAQSKSIDTSAFAQNIDALIGAGFRNYLRPVPPPGVSVLYKDGEKCSSGKVPAKYGKGWFGWPGWQQPHRTSDADIEAWRRWPDAGLCLVLGQVVAFDIDVKIPAADRSFAAERSRGLVRKIGELIAAELGCRVDQLPMRTRPGNSSVAILLRTESELSKSKLSFGDGFAVEFLARGQQIVVAGRHKSGDLQTSNLAQHPFGAMPVLTEAGFEAVWKRSWRLAIQ